MEVWKLNKDESLWESQNVDTMDIIEIKSNPRAMMRQFPPNFKDDAELRAMCHAMEVQKERRTELAKDIMFYCMIDEVSEKVLDYLAPEFRVAFYSKAFPIEKKRELIKKAFIFWSKIGTPRVVKESLEILLEKLEVYEWFDYAGLVGNKGQEKNVAIWNDKKEMTWSSFRLKKITWDEFSKTIRGKAYHYKLKTSTVGIDEEMLVWIQRILWTVKRASAVLESIIIELTTEGAIYFGSFLHEKTYKTAWVDEHPTRFNHLNNLYIGSFLHERQIETIWIDEYPRKFTHINDICYGITNHEISREYLYSQGG